MNRFGLSNWILDRIDFTTSHLSNDNDLVIFTSRLQDSNGNI